MYADRAGETVVEMADSPAWRGGGLPPNRPQSCWDIYLQELGCDFACGQSDHAVIYME